MRALVLGGGGIDGAFQAGAVRAVLRAGFRPEIVAGISVGALNATYLASQVRRAPKGPIPWPAIGDGLVEFWGQEVMANADIVESIVESNLRQTTVAVSFDKRPEREENTTDFGILGRAIDLGATSIVCIPCQPDELEPVTTDGDPALVLERAWRVLAMLGDQILIGDLDTLLDTNEQLLEEGWESGELRGKRFIPVLVVRPEVRLEVDINQFTSVEMAEMIGLGDEGMVAAITKARGEAKEPGHQVVVEMDRGRRRQRASARGPERPSTGRQPPGGKIKLIP